MDLDLCVKPKNGPWRIFTSYPVSSREKAVKDAEHLARQPEYDAVYLIQESARKIIYTFQRSGQVMPIHELLVKMAHEKPKETNNAMLQLQEGRRQRYQVQMRQRLANNRRERFANALRVGLGGFSLAIIVAVYVSMRGAGVGSVALTFALMGTITTYIAVWVHSAYEMADPDELIRRADEAFQARIKPSYEALDKAFTIARDYRWNAETSQMLGDSHFGLLLYLLGMARTLSEHYGIAQAKLDEHIARLMETVGLEPLNVYNCARNLSEYLLYPRYQNMYQEGQNTTAAHLQNPTTPFNVRPALDRWAIQGEDMAEDEADAETPHVSAVMFTDIVNFTQNQQTQGDAWMMGVLQAHNDIVRAALMSFQGHEVKHTGDGIMASFPDLPGAIYAAVAIQKGLESFNLQNPVMRFEVRIGISTGSPVHMDGDLFGTPVNMAARVLPYADGREIALSETAWQDAQALHLNFTPLPDVTLKGFEGTHTVYKLYWENAATPASRPAPLGQAAPLVDDEQSTTTEPPTNAADGVVAEDMQI